MKLLILFFIILLSFNVTALPEFSLDDDSLGNVNKGFFVIGIIAIGILILKNLNKINRGIFG